MTPAPAASFTSGLPADDVSACLFDATVGDMQSWNGSGRGGQFLTPSSSLNAKRVEGDCSMGEGGGFGNAARLRPFWSTGLGLTMTRRVADLLTEER